MAKENKIEEENTLFSIPEFGLIVKGETLVPHEVYESMVNCYETENDLKIAIREWVIEDIKKSVKNHTGNSMFDLSFDIFEAVFFPYLIQSFGDLLHWESYTILKRKL